MEARPPELPMSVTLKMAAGDLVLTSAGRFQSISGLEKATQDVAETYLTNYDPDDPPWHSTGSEFFLIDENTYAYNTIGIRAIIERMAHDALERLMDAQQDDPEVDDEELIEEISFLNVWQIGALSWAFYSHCTTSSEEKVETGFDMDLSQQLPAAVKTAGLEVPGIGTKL